MYRYHLHPWPLFPSDAAPSVARSLSLQFILHALIDGDVDKLCFYSEILLQASHIDGNEIRMSLEEMKKNGSRGFFTALIPFLHEARRDENVLTYLIEHKDALNSLLGNREIERLLQSFFPAGHAALRAAIYEGYAKRGFTSFFDSIEQIIDAIEWETPCHSPMTL